MVTSFSRSQRPTPDGNSLAALRGDDLPAPPAPQPPGPRPGGRLDLTPILGIWENADEGESGGILRMAVTEPKDGGLRVRAYGTGAPAPRDWGEIDAIFYAPTVNAGDAWAFTCTYDFGFMQTTIVSYIKLGDLVTTTYNVFRDGSGRADYWTREFFYLKEARHAAHHA